MESLRIAVCPTYIAIPCNHYGDLSGGGDIRRVLDKFREMEFEYHSRKWLLRNRYYIFDRLNQEMRLPRNALSLVTDTLSAQRISCEIVKGETVTPRSIDISLADGWEVRDYQKRIVDHLSDTTKRMRGSDLQTGKGKTFCASATISRLKQCAMVIADGLLEQWESAVKEQLALTDDEVYTLKGSGSVIRIMGSEIKPKVFIASLDTLRVFALGGDTYTNCPTWLDFQRYFGIGVKLFDEYHRSFHALNTIDLMSNIQNNLYLSATPKRNKKSEQAIFELVYPADMTIGGEEYEKYVNITGYAYGMDIPRESMFNTFKGYSQAKYELYLSNNPRVRQRFIREVLQPIIQQHYLKLKDPGEKLLIFCATVKLCELLRDYLRHEYPDMVVNTAVGKDPESNKYESDIIVSTPKSCGTGTDIPLLRTAIRLDSDSSEPETEQRLGRLRKLASGNTPEFVDVYNGCLSRHNAHFATRAKIYSRKGLQFVRRTL